jgi:transposase
MMGQQPRTESLFNYFRLQDQIPEDHLLRLIDSHIDFSFVREQLKDFYSPMGRPSIDPEVLLRLLLVGYLYGITSERRLLDEVRMHLAYRWFTRLGFEQEIPDHSTFSKNRHGRFRQCGVFRKIFEQIVQRCLEAGLVEGRNLAVDGTLVGANASSQSRVPREKLVEVAQISRTVQEYLRELERQNPVADPEERPIAQEMVSRTDPDAAWAVKSGPSDTRVLRQLSCGHDEPSDFVGRCYAGVLPSRSAGRAANDRACEPAWNTATESGSGQGLRKRRVSGLAIGT